MAVGSAVVAGIGLVSGVAQAISGYNDKKDAEKSADALKASQQPITNPYANLSISTQGGNFAGQQALRSEATQTNNLANAGGRGLAYIPQVARNTALSQQQIAGNFDQQQKEVDQLKARGEVYKAQQLEARYNREMEGYADQYNAGNQSMWNGIQQGIGVASSAISPMGALSGLGGGGGAPSLSGGNAVGGFNTQNIGNVQSIGGGGFQAQPQLQFGNNTNPTQFNYQAL